MVYSFCSALCAALQKRSFHIITSTKRNMCTTAVAANEELVDWLGLPTNGKKDYPVLLPAVQRSLIHKYNLLHRGIGAMLLRKSQDKVLVFVHKRASTKRLFPSMLDMFIGGVSTSGETAESTLFRELGEECGIDLKCKVNRIENAIDGGSVTKVISSIINTNQSTGSSVLAIGDTIIKTDLNHCLVSCFLVALDEILATSIRFRDGEIEYGEWIPLETLENDLISKGDKDFVPDGMQVYFYCFWLLLLSTLYFRYCRFGNAYHHYLLANRIVYNKRTLWSSNNFS